MQCNFIENEGKSTDYSEFFYECLNDFARDCHLGTSPSPISNVICSADSDIHGTQTADNYDNKNTRQSETCFKSKFRFSEALLVSHRIIQTKTKNEKQL